MPVLEGLWGPDLRMQDSSLGVCPDEAPGSPVWTPLRTPPVTCGGLSLALELPALLRQLRAAWRARRGGPRGPESSRPDPWVEEEEKQDGGAHLEAAVRLNSGPAALLLVDRRASFPLIDVLKAGVLQGELQSGTSRKHLQSSETCRPAAHLHLLDQDYRGQAAFMLSKVGSWNFDIFLFDRLTNGNVLVTLGLHLFTVSGLIHHFQLDVVKLHRFLSLLQDDYHAQNPYHNAVHAADVTQAMFCFLQEPKLAEHLSPLDVFLALMAAAAHDVDHPGVNQPFLIKTRHHLASLYQNTSVLESHHWRSTVGMLRESGLLTHLDADVTQDVEQQLGSLILATDISRQNEFLLTFREHLDQQDLDLQLAEHRHFILQMALKCADVCNPCRIWRLSRQWSERVCEEFYRQGDLEKRFDLEISPLCDQQLHSVSDIQIGFISYIVEPLFEEWQRFTDPSLLSRTMMDLLTHNKTCWSRTPSPSPSPSPSSESESEDDDDVP